MPLDGPYGFAAESAEYDAAMTAAVGADDLPRLLTLGRRLDRGRPDRLLLADPRPHRRPAPRPPAFSLPLLRSRPLLRPPLRRFRSLNCHN